MPIRVTRLDPPSSPVLAQFLVHLAANGHPYADPAEWTPKVLRELPERRQVFVASDNKTTLGLLVLTSGFLETWGAPTDVLGGNPLLPQDDLAAAIHTALLLEATAWIEREGETGLEILLPMGRANWKRDERMDGFLGHLGFERFYFAMTRDLDPLPECDDSAPEIAPTASATPEELYENYAACVSRGEIELVARQTTNERRAYFDSLLDDTLSHPGSLALFEDDRLLGFTLATAWDETAAHLAWIGIAPEHRRRGNGRRLLCGAMAACRESGIERMSLYTDVSLPAKSIYQRVGFQSAGTLTYRWRHAGLD
ncbi:MAG: GNAT family N-acetyltransferase [Candidatus Bipolaricaulis sp.]|nr:GNAT family N-acetyltransferase [Candidatus Bipolaricaulis sp.]MDD5646012.1 GNAT family N-acetyltransferase [Candidatus Bipolaricaulis sp.]